MKTTYPFDSGNVAIYIARAATQNYIKHQAELGNLSKIAKDEHRVAIWLACASLFNYVASGEIKLVMIERWIAEAVASASQPPHQKNTLTGQIVYQIWCDMQALDDARPWSDTPELHTSFELLATALMDHLHICYSCGRHPKDGDLEEVAGMMLCNECTCPPCQ